MNIKYKDGIRGALLASGAWTILLSFSPVLAEINNNLNTSILIGIAMIVVALFWIK
jgi:hypothetical protein